MTNEPYDLTRLWLATRVRRLWESSSEDLGSACRDFDVLVAEHGRVRMARALSDAHLERVGDPDAIERNTLSTTSRLRSAPVE